MNGRHIADRDLLPSDAVFTPTVHAKRLGAALGLPYLYLKDETRLPTGTTKDRMAAVALAYMSERDVRGFCTSSTGNSSTAYAQAIGRLAELVMYLFTASQFVDRVHLPDTKRIVPELAGETARHRHDRALRRDVMQHHWRAFEHSS